jgi:protoporphyrin/coproporphyrin ferrochelatase
MNRSDKLAVILINTGTPASPAKRDVWVYLTRFLNDRRIITIPWLFRKILVNLIIIPFRIRKSAGLYRRVWTEEGSPLLINAVNLRDKLQEALGPEAGVFLAMRYSNPSIKRTVAEIRAAGYGRIVVVPLYPQYASSTSGSAIEALLKSFSYTDLKTEISIIRSFHSDPAFIRAKVMVAASYKPREYDHVLFSFHGLPLSHISAMHIENGDDDGCFRRGETESCRKCYAGDCFETAGLIAEGLGLSRKDYSVAFQSRLTSGWTNPFADDVIISLAKKGVKSLLVISPSFVSDCLETIVEAGEDYKKLFIENGGESYTLVESLNSNPEWVLALKGMILRDQRISGN